MHNRLSLTYNCRFNYVYMTAILVTVSLFRDGEFLALRKFNQLHYLQDIF